MLLARIDVCFYCNETGHQATLGEFLCFMSWDIHRTREPATCFFTYRAIFSFRFPFFFPPTTTIIFRFYLFFYSFFFFLLFPSSVIFHGPPLICWSGGLFPEEGGMGGSRGMHAKMDYTHCASYFEIREGAGGTVRPSPGVATDTGPGSVDSHI